MTRRPQRTTLALVLAGLAISVPCAAWFVAGSRAARDESARLLQEPLERAARESSRLAQRVEHRLDALLQHESRRSHLEYQNLGNIVPGSCSYEIKLKSSLAAGPQDPLIWTHFQIDEFGQLSLPALALDTGPEPGRAIHEAIQEELECATSYRLAAMRPLHSAKQGDNERLVQTTEGTTTVGAFDWYTVQMKGQPALVALRKVASTRAVLTQGFAVLSASLTDLLDDAAYPAHVRPGKPGSAADARLNLGGQSWTVEMDTSAALAAAAATARRATRKFWLTFLVGSLAAGLAGVLVVSLVWQSETLSRRRASFAASAAHELRTPLTGLQLFGEMLANGTGDPTRHKEYAQRVSEEAERLGRVVTNVLGYSRLERGGLTVNPQPGDLAVAVRDSVSRLTPSLQTKSADLELTITEPLSRTRFDGDAVHQILQNLIDNAEKFSRSARERTIRVFLADRPEGPTLSVVDRGVGVSAAARRKIFEPFARGQDPDAPPGLGIGLALVQALAQGQGARVSHSDVEGGGSCFSVTFEAC